MKRFRIFTLLLASAAWAGISTSPVHQATASGTSALSVTITAAASGNTLICAVAVRGSSLRTVSSITTTNVTWANYGRGANSTTGNEIWYGYVSGGSSGTSVTFSFSGTTTFTAANCSEWSGILNPSPADGTLVSSSGTSTSATIGAFSTTSANDLLIAAEAQPNGTAPTATPANFTALTRANNSTNIEVNSAYLVPATIGSQGGGSWTITSAAWATTIAAFKPGSATALAAAVSDANEVQEAQFRAVALSVADFNRMQEQVLPWKGGPTMSWNYVTMAWNSVAMTWNAPTSVSYSRGTADLVAAADRASGNATHAALVSDRSAPADSPVRQVARVLVVTETLTVREATTRQASRLVSVVDLVRAVDTAAGVAGSSGAAMTWNGVNMTWNAVTMTWNAATTGYNRSTVDRVNLADSAAGVAATSGAVMYWNGAAMTWAGVSMLWPAAAYSRATSERVLVSEKVLHVDTLLLTYEGVHGWGYPAMDLASGSASTGSHAYSASVAELVGLADRAAGAGAHFSARMELLSVYDRASGMGVHYASIRDTLIVVDLPGATGAHNAAARDAMAAFERQAVVIGHYGSARDGRSVADLSAASGAHYVNARDMTVLLDRPASFGGHFAVALDTGAGRESVALAATHAMATTESLLALDAGSRAAVLHLSVRDTLVLTDGASGAKNSNAQAYSRITADLVRLLEGHAYQLGRAVNASEMLSASDRAARAGTFSLAVSDLLFLRDQAQRVGVFSAGVFDRTAAADTAFRFGAFFAAVRDRAGLIDSATRLGAFAAGPRDFGTLAESALGFHVAVPQNYTRDTWEVLVFYDFATGGYRLELHKRGLVIN